MPLLKSIPQLHKEDLDYLVGQGISAVDAHAQAERIHQGFVPIELVEACTPDNGGILVLDHSEKYRLQSVFRKSTRQWTRFVPASGASSRMFQSWQSALSEDDQSQTLCSWNKDFAKYPFCIAPPRYDGFANTQALPQDWKGKNGLRFLLQDLGFAMLPKAAIPFHSYPSGELRTPFVEHLSEAQDAGLQLHFTISPEHHQLFQSLEQQGKSLGYRVPVSFSFQSAASQSLALNAQGQWVRNPKGQLLLRPSGHGALLPNLAKSPTAWVFIRNIDNVVPEGSHRDEANTWREALAGLLEETWVQVQAWKKDLAQSPSPSRFRELCLAIGSRFGLSIEDDWTPSDLIRIISAPIRICGMVRNTGEPGGGPYFVRNQLGHISPQIVESAQVDRAHHGQFAIFQEATHFNPVELVCALENSHGHRYDLENYVDPETGFRVEKSFGGKPLFALEKPGLWNGSMAHWLTIFVEIPELCFAPVKIVQDLLRPEHQLLQSQMSNEIDF